MAATQPQGTTSPARNAGDVRPVAAVEVSDQDLRQACGAGDAKACITLGDRIKRDLKATPERLQEMTRAYQTACDRAAADGCAALGSAYQQGLGVPRDPARARELYTRACNAKSGRGCSRLGALYLMGVGVEKSAERAIGYSQAGCDAGDALGCVNLGLMCERGDGLPQDGQRAHELYDKACRLGEGAGCRQLGSLYATGFASEPPNPKLSLMWSEKACRMRDATGCGNAGMNYQVGFGVASNPVRAASLYLSACRLGEQRFCDLLERFKQGAQTQPTQPARPAQPKPGASESKARVQPVNARGQPP